MNMRLIIYALFSILIKSSACKEYQVYTWTNYVDHMSITIQENNQYELIISSCMFQVKCEGQYAAYGDSISITTKEIKENIHRGGNGHWKKTSFCKKIEKDYFNNFQYVIIKDSVLLANELRWQNLVFTKKE